MINDTKPSYGIGTERGGSFPDWREWPFLIDGDQAGLIERTHEGYRATVRYTGVPRETLELAVADGKRQAEAARGRFFGIGLNVYVRALSATDTKPARFAVEREDGVRAEVSRPQQHEGITAAEWAARQVMPDREPVYVTQDGNGWTFKV